MVLWRYILIEINPNQYDIYTDYRIVIYSINRKEFDKIEVISANNIYLVKEDYILNNLADFKYKLQVTKNSKWTNKNKYLKFYDDMLLENIFTDKLQVSDQQYKKYSKDIGLATLKTTYLKLKLLSLRV